MSLTSAETRELEERGWSVVRRKARRPDPVPASDVLVIGEDVTLDDQDPDPPLSHLYSNR